ncbi:MAG: BufA1 family periplasmic bufferin-type metallophore [Acetobacteraceae bacterium]
MDRRTFATSVLGSAVGLAALAATHGANAQMMKLPPGANMKVVEANMALAKKYHLVACYGVNAVGRNDCAAGAHSCAGQATIAHDPNSFVLLPAGDCQKIAGGSLKPGK